MSGVPADAAGLLRLLRTRGVRLTPRGDALDFDAPADVLTDELVEAMRRHKSALIDLLGGAGPVVRRSAPASRSQVLQFHLTAGSDTPQVLTVAIRLALRGRLDHAALRQALTDLTARHPALRTRYELRSDTVYQQVLAPRPLPLTVVDVTEAELAQAVVRWASEPFALRSEPPVRAMLARVAAAPSGDGTQRHELALAMHHSVVDGWSVEVLVRDLGALYRAALTGEPADLPRLTADFVDFSDWERDFLASENTARLLRRWRQGLPARLTPTVLPTDRPRGATASDAGSAIDVTLPGDLVATVSRYAAQRGVTPFVVFAAGFAALVHELTAAPSVTLTVPVANRSDPRFADVVGIFANSTWLIVEVAGVRSFHELVARTAEATWQLLAVQSVPSRVQNEALGPAFAGAPPRVYLSMLDPDPVLRLPGLAPAPALDVPLAGARGDQLWQLRPDPDGGMSLLVEYATSLFDAATVHAAVARYRSLLHAALTGPDRWAAA